MAGSKFMVHGGRRWRELELDTGRMSGWGAVNFLCVQRGKLELVPRARVLRALRALTARAPGRCAGKLGPRLSQKRYLRNERKPKDRRELETVGRQKDLSVHTCCQHHSHCSTDTNFNSILKPPTSSVAVQCRPLVTTGVQATFTSETAGFNVELQTNKSQRNAREELSNGDHGSDEKWEIKSRSRNKLQLVKKKQSQECQSSVSHVGLETEKRNESERERVNRNEPIEVQVKEVRRSQSRESSRESERRDLRKKKLQSNKDLRRKKKKTKKEEQEQEILCKELVITEEVVTWLRNFLVTDDTNVFGVDLEQFDSNNAYKEQLFYRLNPVVDLERCPRIARIATRDRARQARDRARQADSVSLEDFITTLGLRSVADTSPTHSRYRMRARRKNDVTDARTRSSGDSGGDKENVTAKPVTKDRSCNRQVDRVLEETNKKHTNRSASSQQSKADSNNANANLGGGQHLNEAKEATAKGKGKGEKSKQEDAPPPAKISKRDVGGGMREYSADEDAHILRWVRGEGRARLVKGNRTWMQLQSFHNANTSVFRTWQSLRNRYLRYLLPALGRLELPPQEASRLRAAAATGELKARNLPPRRNSLFQQPPVRSAWAQRPRAPLEQTAVASDAEDTAPPRTLRSAQTTAHSSSKQTNTRTQATANSSFKRTNARAETTAQSSPKRTNARAETTAQSSPKRTNTRAQTTTHSSPNRTNTRAHTTANSSLNRNNTRAQTTANSSSNRTNTRAQTTTDSSPKRTNTHPQTTAHSPPRHTNKPFVRTPTYSEITKRFALRHRSTPNSDTVSPNDATATSSVTSVTTVSSDRQVRQTRRSSKRRLSSSDSERPSKLRKSSRHRDTSVQNVDKKDRHNENAISNDRQTKEHQRSISLDSDTDSQQSNKRRRSARRRDSSVQNVDKKDRHNENAIPNDRQTKEHQRSISLDSDTDSQQSNKRRRSARRRDSSVQNVDKKDRHNENAILNDRQTKEHQRSISLDSDTDSQQSNKRRRSARRRDRSVQNVDKKDRHNENAIPNDRQTKEHQRSISLDSDTDSQQSNKRRRSARRRDSSVQNVDKKDRHNENTTSNDEQTKNRQRSISLDSNTDSQQSYKSNSDDNSDRQIGSEDSDTEPQQVNRRRRSARRRDRRVPNDDNSDRQIGSEDSDTEPQQVNRRRRSVRQNDDNTYRQIEKIADKGSATSSPGSEIEVPLLIRSKQSDTSVGKQARRSRSVAKIDRQFERGGQNADILNRQRSKSAQRTDKTDRHRDKNAQRTDKTDRRHDRSGPNADVLDRQRSKSAQRTDKTDRQRDKSAQRTDKTDRHRDKSAQRTDKTDRQSGSARDDVKNGSLRNKDKLDSRGRQIEKSDTNNRTREKSAQDTDKNYRHRDRSARRGDNEMQSGKGRLADKTGRLADKTGRQPPRTRRLYNPNAM